MKINQAIIEKTVLTSFIKDNTTEDIYKSNLKYLQNINIEIFESKEHQHILKILQHLDNNNYDLESLLIENKLNKQAQKAYIDILTTNGISNIENYIKLLKENASKRGIEKEIISLKKSLASGNAINTINIVEKLNELESTQSSSQNKEYDDKFDKYLDSFAISEERIKDIDLNLEYIYNNLIVKNELTMVAAKPASGKSLTTVAIVNTALTNNIINRCIYFDLDNSLTTLKQRNIDALHTEHGNKLKYIHSAFAGKNEVFRIIKQLQNMNLKDKLIVFDSAKNFMSGGDRDKNKDVSKLTDIFKTLRDKGATVIFLHHTNKPSRDIEGLQYAGSSAWEEDSTNCFILDFNQDKETFIFKCIKNRVGDLEDQAYKYNESNHTLHKVDFDEASLSEDDEEIIDEINLYLKDNLREVKKRSTSQIEMSLVKIGFVRNKVRSILKKFIDKKWSCEAQVHLNNRKVFMLLEKTLSKKPIITNFKNNNIEISSGEVGEVANRSTEGFLNEVEKRRGGGPLKMNIIQSNIEIPLID